jgi:hypothetical protein
VLDGAPVRGGDLDPYRRLWLRRRNDVGYPTLKEFYVASLHRPWTRRLTTSRKPGPAHVEAPLARLESRADTAVTIVQQALIATGQRHTAT